MLSTQIEQDLLSYLTSFSDKDVVLVRRIRDYYDCLVSKKTKQSMLKMAPELLGALVGCTTNSVKKWRSGLQVDSSVSIQLMIFAICLQSLVGVSVTDDSILDFQI